MSGITLNIGGFDDRGPKWYVVYFQKIDNVFQSTSWNGKPITIDFFSIDLAKGSVKVENSNNNANVCIVWVGTTIGAVAIGEPLCDESKIFEAFDQNTTAKKHGGGDVVASFFILRDSAYYVDQTCHTALITFFSTDSCERYVTVGGVISLDFNNRKKVERMLLHDTAYLPIEASVENVPSAKGKRGASVTSTKSAKVPKKDLRRGRAALNV